MVSRIGPLILATFRINVAVPLQTAANRRVHFHTRQRMEGDTDGGIVTTTACVIHGERVADDRVVRKVGRRFNPEQRIRDISNPRTIGSGIFQNEIPLWQHIRTQGELPTEQIAIVNAPAILHFNVPRSVKRASDQARKRIVRMIELCSRSHVRRIHYRIMFISSTVNIATRSRGIRITLSGVVRPTIVPTCSGFIAVGRRITGTGTTRMDDTQMVHNGHIIPRHPAS